MQYRSQALETADNSSYSNQQTVMLVDDSETDRATYIRYLQNSSESQYTFVEAETGSEALEIYAQHQPDIVLLDYLLPDLDGLEWLAQWKQQHSSICPVIVLTGQGDENIAVQFIKMGATDYLVKGQITPEKLKLSVDKEIALQKLQQDKNDLIALQKLQQDKNDLIAKLKARNDQLRQSEARFRNTFEQAAVGIAHVATDGKWLKVNQKLCQIVGYTLEELSQKTFQDITHPEDLNSDLKYIDRILAGEIATYSMEKRYIHQNKSYIWINLTVSLVKKSNGEPDYFICVIENISDRKILELALQKSLKRLSNLHTIDKAILSAKKPQEIAQTVIDNIQNFFKCQRASILTFDWKQQTATTLDNQGIGKHLVDEGFETSLEVWRDLIEQLQNQEQDREQNYIVACLSQSPSLSQAIKPLKTTKLDCFIVFPLKCKGNLLGILQLWVNDPNEVTTDEGLAMVGEIANQLAIALEQARLYKQAQNYALELETRVTQRTAQLEEINQELKTFSYSISHDLKTPLRAIQGFATALYEDYAENLDDLGKEYTWRLTTSTQQMERLIQDLLTYSRLSQSEIQIQKINLASVIAKVLEQLEPEIAKTQTQITIDEPLLSMMGNKTVLYQVIGNLLTNAVKFLSPDTVPQIHIWTETKGDRSNLENSRVRLWVEDNGIGIKPQHQERIFQVFERLHGNEAYSGTGIGLAIVKKGMERLGGRFGVESQPDRGSRFWIEGRRE